MYKGNTAGGGGPESNMDLYTVVLAGMILALLWMVRVKSRKNNLPPGPPALPLIGNLHQIDRYAPFSSFLEFSKTYGPVMTLHLGWQRTVVIAGYDAVKDAFINQADDFMGRGPLPILVKANTIYALANSNGERWHQLRRFTITTLKDFGMGRKGMEEWIQEESQHMRAYIHSLKGKPFDPTFLMSCVVANIVCCLVFCERFDYDNQQFLGLLNVLVNVLKFGCSPYGQLYNIFPTLLEYLPGRQHAVFAQIHKVRKFIGDKIQDHKDSLDPNSPRDYIDSFLIQMEKEKNNPKSEFLLDRLVGTVSNLFLAGTETTSSTLRHALLVLIKYPDIQEKMQQEIDAVIGKRTPGMQDRKSLPFSDAVVHEIQRSLDIVPFAVPHCALRDITFRGYSIPKGTKIIPLLHSVLRDEKQWVDPWSFNPNNFLDHNGNFKKNPAFMPFSAGRRACAGESLARMELFIFITSLLQDFTFSYSEGPAHIDLTPEFASFGKLPHRYNITATAR
ncbi:cytochrome P450 2C31-like isoform X2 [Gouania willdenowi]|uniref:cytochrome P450 2C31-like isoform X2 n=1 Tax=Gouania willdenowi TaxID=441366 RepID=UPI0010550149|nr:cytochrome P450 2C31-like isoform X2 [Gouania willdenowi]